MPNNRQLAIAILVGVAATLALAWPRTRSSALALLRQAASPKLALPFVMFAGWIAGAAVLADQVGIWSPELTADTVMWFVTAGVLLLARFENTWHDPKFVRRTLKSTLQLGLVVGVVAELKVMSLTAELIFALVTAMFALIAGVAATEPAHRIVATAMNKMLTSAGIAVLLYSVVAALVDWRSYSASIIAKAVVLPVWLTAIAVPYVYAVALFAAYEMIFLRIRFNRDDRRRRAGHYLTVLWAFNLRLRDAARFAGGWPHRLAEAETFAEGRRVVQEFRARTAADDHREQDNLDRLMRFAGVAGVDEEGRQLDRREFDETTAALRWIATCQMGWFHNHGGQYRADLLEILGHDFTSQGLPREADIQMDVAAGGAAWHAWRRTATGWVFAIGSNSPRRTSGSTTDLPRRAGRLATTTAGRRWPGIPVRLSTGDRPKRGRENASLDLLDSNVRDRANAHPQLVRSRREISGDLAER